MPTMSASSVGVLPMYSQSAMALEAIRQAMVTRPPILSSLTGGWASTSDTQSNLGMPNTAPPSSEPEIVAAADGAPETLQARYYYWRTPPAGLQDQPSYNPHMVRRLDAIDVVISREDDGHIGILLSSRNRTLLQRRDGVVQALQDILQSDDASIKIDRWSSPLALADTDVFLWLTVQHRDSPLVSPDLLLDRVSGISGRDASARTADLRAGVDFTRPNFLTAVAEADTLGPIEISFVHTVNAEQRAYGIKLWVDGGFSIQSTDIHFASILDTRDKMMTATFQLAYSLVPQINSLYESDDKWSDRRMEVIEAAMEDLEQRYRSAREALKERKERSPQPLDAPTGEE